MAQVGVAPRRLRSTSGAGTKKEAILPKKVHTLIIGTGHAGISAAIHLLKGGFNDFIILEKASSIGGTWRDNTYPGCSCDNMSFWYNFTFDMKLDWSREYAGHKEILGYLESLANKYDLYKKVIFNSEVSSLTFDDVTLSWTAELQGGGRITADAVITAVGQLNRPNIPSFPGQESFLGTQFHSARWDHSYDLKGKRVAVVGNAASAVQFIPEIAKEVGHLSIFQRSANYVIKRPNGPFSKAFHTFLSWFPFVAYLIYLFAWLFLGDVLLEGVMRQNRLLAYLSTNWALENLHKCVKDPKVRAQLTPDYPIGFKRLLFADDYYSTFVRQNVSLITDGIQAVTPKGILSKNGEEVEVDVIIWATGFKSTEFLSPMKILGSKGRDLKEEWKDGARAYLGVTVSGFPNLFMLYGPNTNLGQNTILVMIEAQSRYITDCLRKMKSQGLKAIDAKKSIMDKYNSDLQAALNQTVWAKQGKSWYKNEAGVITNNWPHTTAYYAWLLRSANLDDFEHLNV